MFRKRHPPVGATPGTLVIHPRALPPAIKVIEYAPDRVREHDIADPEELRAFLSDGGLAWIDVQGLGDEAALRAIGEIVGLHALALEDVVNVPQRGKLELYDDHVLFVTRMAIMPEPPKVETEQVSLILGRNYVLTFQELHGDVLDPVRARIRRDNSRIRTHGPDYLAYAILDAVIDGYYPIMESCGEHIEDLEQAIIEDPRPEIIQQIHALKRELLAIRRAVWPQREALSAAIRDENPFISDDVRVFLRDCYDHCVQIMDAVETYRELTGGLMDMYLSHVGNRQNEIMKVLTIMATIFIPLTFMAGVYGMNFEHMPELHAPWAYPALWLVMLTTAAGMIVFFRRKGWLGGSPSDRRD